MKTRLAGKRPRAIYQAKGSFADWTEKRMADGREMNINDRGRRLRLHGRELQQTSQRAAQGGVVDCRLGEDRRNTIYFIPAARRQVPGVIDYGVCKVDLNH